MSRRTTALLAALATPVIAISLNCPNAVADSGSGGQPIQPGTTQAATYTVPTSALKQWNEKNATIQQISQLRAQSRQGISPNMLPGDGGYPSSYIATGWTFAIHKEGEGNSKKSYTCGPSATRNMVQAMTGADYGENQFAVWEGTTSSSGTAITGIVSTLNGHFSGWGGWGLKKPAYANDLWSSVVTDTAKYNQGVIMNVNTGKLSFFNNKSLRHYDVAQGYTATTIQIAEEWDPIYIYGSSSYGNPYGTHAEPLNNVYAAVSSSPTGQVVI